MIPLCDIDDKCFVLYDAFLSSVDGIQMKVKILKIIFMGKRPTEVCLGK